MPPPSSSGFRRGAPEVAAELEKTIWWLAEPQDDPADEETVTMPEGMPTSLITVGRMRGEVVEYCNTMFHFADPSLVVSAVSGVINQQGRAFTHGFEIHLEQATLHYEFAGFADKGELMPLKVLTTDGQVVRPDVGGGDPSEAFVGEIAEVVKCVEADQSSPTLSGELARDAIILCHKQTDSVKTGGLVKI